MSDQPTNKTPDGTIDITNVVSSLQNTWVTWATNTVMAAIAVTPFLSWMAWPVIGTLVKLAIELVTQKVAKSAVMGAFFLNTAIRKASQADDYLAAVNAKDALPETASWDEYEKAERAEMAAFHNFVVVTQ